MQQQPRQWPGFDKCVEPKLRWDVYIRPWPPGWSFWRRIYTSRGSERVKEFFPQRDEEEEEEEEESERGRGRERERERERERRQGALKQKFNSTHYMSKITKIRVLGGMASTYVRVGQN